MSTLEPPRNIVIRNLANIVSFLGILPICILFGENGYQYLFPFLIYNNAMDDLDGVLAGKLNIRSKFGGNLDNVCDAISHTVIVIFVGMQFVQETASLWLGWVCVAASLLAVAAIIARIVARIDPTFVEGNGSPTNELIRHLFFVLLISQIFEFEPTLFLIATFMLHSMSMIVPFRLPYLVRSLTKSAKAIGLVNVSLLLAWLVPYAAPFIAALFIVTYLASFSTGGLRWLRTNKS